MHSAAPTERAYYERAGVFPPGAPAAEAGDAPWQSNLAIKWEIRRRQRQIRWIGSPAQEHWSRRKKRPGRTGWPSRAGGRSGRRPRLGRNRSLCFESTSSCGLASIARVGIGTNRVCDGTIDLVSSEAVHATGVLDREGKVGPECGGSSRRTPKVVFVPPYSPRSTSATSAARRFEASRFPAPDSRRASA